MSIIIDLTVPGISDRKVPDIIATHDANMHICVLIISLLNYTQLDFQACWKDIARILQA